MKVLLCTPYKGTPFYVHGGIVVWAQIILNYHKLHNDDLEILPLSFDRSIRGRNTTNKYIRNWYTFKEISIQVFQTLYTIQKENVNFLHLCTSAGMSLLKDYIILKGAKTKGIKTAIHLHFGRTPELFSLKNSEYYRLIKVLDLASVIITMDKKTYDCLIQNGYSNVKYLPNPISDNLISTIEKQNDNIRIPRQLLFVGHVYKTKGVYELVEACKRIKDIDLRIVGKYTDDVKYDLIKIAGEKSDKWLHFIGEVEHKAVIEEFLHSDIFVFPSYTEGFPNVILEAMFCKIPIIASNVGAIPEMLNEGNIECGLLIEPQNTEQLYNAIINLLNDESLKLRISNNAYTRLINTYTMSIIWKQLTSIWKER